MNHLQVTAYCMHMASQGFLRLRHEQSSCGNIQTKVYTTKRAMLLKNLEWAPYMRVLDDLFWKLKVNQCIGDDMDPNNKQSLIDDLRHFISFAASFDEEIKKEDKGKHFEMLNKLISLGKYYDPKTYIPFFDLTISSISHMESKEAIDKSVQKIKRKEKKLKSNHTLNQLDKQFVWKVGSWKSIW